MTRTLLTHASASGHAASVLPTWSWRISVAELQENGPFSVFEDVDRTLILLRGGALILNRPNGVAVLDRPGAQVSFRGEESIQATITPAPAQALNVMTRRGTVRSTVHVVRGHPTALPESQASMQRQRADNAPPPTTVAFVGAGRYEIALSDASGLGQTLALHGGEGAAINRSVYPGLGVRLLEFAPEELDQRRLVNPPACADAIHPEALEALDAPLDSDTGASPWLVLTTLESVSD